MREYPKIDTLYERDEAFSITNVLKRPVLATINEWVVTEKVDGTNIRVHLEGDKVSFGGRTANAQLPADLVAYLTETFTFDKMAALRRDDAVIPITLFGEGYGTGIQKGGDYRPDKAFILFDVLIGDQWWLDDENVTQIAERLGIARVPILGRWSLGHIREKVEIGIPSVIAQKPRMMEGIVARTIEPLFDKNGKRLIIKLKTCDWKKK